MAKKTTSLFTKGQASIKKTAHFIGVGGIGMSALARWFLALKWAVSGSDMISSSLTRKLKKDGVKVKIGHKKAHISPKVGLVVYNQAIPASNPELKEAKRLGIPAFTYPEVLGSLTRDYATIAVAGSHGKSTTTALLSLVLMKAGFDPTVILGTLLKQFKGGNFRAGRSEYLLIEADEWKASFLNYSPLFAILTNVDKEHLDFYKNYSAIKKTFLKFISNIKDGGILVANKDCEKLFVLKKRIQKICKEHDVELIWYSLKQPAAKKIKKVLKVPGRHNVSNALAVYTLAKTLGVKEKVILEALGTYRDAWRRMEYRGRFGKNPVYDDYAHHPTEIKASLQAFREKFPKKKIICVFQPHQAHRTQNLFKEFVSAFDLADHLTLFPIYQVAGRDKSHKGYASKDLAQKIAIRNSKLKTQNSVVYLPSPKRLPAQIRNLKLKTQNSVIAMMGAGDIVNYTDLLLKK